MTQINDKAPLHKKASRVIGARGKEPGLARVEQTVKHAEALLRRGVPAENLDRHDERILHKIVVDHAVEDVDSRVVAGRRKQRVRGVERDGPQSETVVPQCAVRLRRQIKVEPAQPAVVAADDEVVAARVHSHARDPAAAGHKRLDERLRVQVVDTHVRLGRNEENGLVGVEQGALHVARALAERALRDLLLQRVHTDGLGAGIVRHRHEVAALVVPREPADLPGVRDVDADAALLVLVLDEGPVEDALAALVVRLLLQQLLRGLGGGAGAHARGKQGDCVAVCNGDEVDRSIRAPRDDSDGLADRNNLDAAPSENLPQANGPVI
eukprot:m.227022 g.227022  ORF g.227022 m.227022 type:complete len:325 (+) comp11518_c0_seq1:165-1139(+)